MKEEEYEIISAFFEKQYMCIRSNLILVHLILKLLRSLTIFTTKSSIFLQNHIIFKLQGATQMTPLVHYLAFLGCIHIIV